jgi:hypothetical protein
MEALSANTKACDLSDQPPVSLVRHNGAHSSQFAWERLFEEASSAERTQWLKEASQTGVLYAHQLGSAVKVIQDRRTVEPTHGAERPSLLKKILAGELEVLAPQLIGDASSPPPFFDEALDGVQQEAVINALRTPDIFLIQGQPGTGKTRVLVELVSQAAASGLRVLLVSPSRVAADRVLAQIAARNVVLPLRCVEAGENLRQLPPAISAITFSEQSKRLVSQCQAYAKEELARRRQLCQQTENDLDTLTRLGEIATHWQKAKEQRKELLTRLQDLSNLVREEAAKEGSPEPSFSKALQVEQERHEATLKELQERIRQTSSWHEEKKLEHHKWVDRVQRQGRLLDAKKHRKFYTLAWWRVLFQGRRAEKRFAEFECREKEAREALAAAHAPLLELQTQEAVENDYHAQARCRLFEAEIARRQSQIERKVNEVNQRQDELLRGWHEGRTSLQPVRVLPESPAAEAIKVIREKVEADLITLKEQCQFSSEWCRQLPDLIPVLPARMLASVNVVAGSLKAISHESTLLKWPFDLLVLDQADSVGEADLLALGQRARRWVLVGHPLGFREDKGQQLSPFQKIWQALHADPGALPYLWIEQHNALTCQLFPLASEQRRWLELERLADHPDVELRILACPGSPPRLAEVVFPTPSFAIGRAKAYLYQQLQELTLRPRAPALRWQQTDQHLMLHLRPQGPPVSSELRVPLEEGVCEVVAAGIAPANGSSRGIIPWETSRLEFSRDHGWDRVRAQEWLRDRTGLRDFGRTSLLQTQWRASPELAAFSAFILQANVPTSHDDRPKGLILSLRGHPPVQFIPVPGMTLGQQSQARGQVRGRAAAATGLELSLSDPRQRQRLSKDLRDRLPQHGLVNVVEAQAVIRTVSDLLGQLDLNGHSANVRTHADFSIAVLSCQSAQVQLLQLLWEREASARTNVPISFDTVGRFREREAAVVLISLCRSNSQRAVSYFDDAGDWPLAFVSARIHLLLFGDTATMVRRSEWQGTLECQTPAAAAYERLLVARLVECIKNPQSLPRVLVVRSGKLP